jgi:Flp pilus assembly protein TadG
MLLIRRLIKNKRGQALVELALTLPLLIMLVIGTIEFGWLFHDYLMVTNASREGARIAITGVDNTAITSRIDAVTTSLKSTKVIIISPDDNNLRVSTIPVTVTVNYNHKVLTPFLGSFIPDPIQLTSSTSMRMEGKK